MELNTPISTLPGVGTYFTYKLKKVGVTTVGDLINYIPTHYQDFSLITPIATLQPGEKVTIQGQIVEIKNIYTRTGKKIQQAVVSDGQETIDVTWFNQPYLVKSLPAGTQISLSGRVEAFGRKKSIVAPQWEKLQPTTYQPQPSTLHTGRLVPIYPETEGLNSKWLRAKVSQVLPLVIEKLQDPLPDWILKKYGLLPLPLSLPLSHFPKTLEEAEKARHRIAFNELFELQLKSLIRKKQWKEQKVAPDFSLDEDKIWQFLNNLPFELTKSQQKAGREILQDLTHKTPMNRLLEGDVGSGKTVVAALACFIAHLNGYQSAVMAPTQILATQHYKTLSTLLKPFGIKVHLLIGGPQRSRLKGDALKGYPVIVGTHALVQQGVPLKKLKKLGLVVIDEQHRFGVRQRAVLSQKTDEGFGPHVLTMTATPIPRTVALAAYGDLDLSTLDELPAGRTPTKTWVVPPQKREGAYNWIRERVKNTDEQAFIVCPLIDESEKEGFKTVKAATAEFEQLSKKIFPDFRLSLLHGKIKGKEKDEIMDKMKRGEVDILVATPVVEVGIDIPNATIMMIEAAERFGLAQLHQLRGRVGRGNKQSYCLLFTESASQNTLKRLKRLEKTLSGRALAELDLELRGPGEMYGTAQHGFPELKVASFSDYELIKASREAARELISEIDNLPALRKIAEATTFVAPN
ncbi:MAG: ATP-dependent DNA helicase RecG [Candidatus Blackburnbacteria bacterium]|nr:ATP-dependent DNA helicase RecG [Candidatus Blackburnbacteria bacterium]